jgi:hypothetical protein
MEAQDRRYFPLEVSSERRQDTDYFGWLVGKFTPEFYSHLLTYLLRMDVSTLNVEIPPMTELKREMIDTTRSLQETFIRLRNEWCDSEKNREDIQVPFKTVWEKFLKWMDDQGLDSSKQAGSYNGFYAKVRHLVEKWKSCDIMYRPNEKLYKILREEYMNEPAVKAMYEGLAEMHEELVAKGEIKP